MTLPRSASTPLFRDDLPRWQHLVHPLWLARLLEGRPVTAAPQGAWCLFEVECGIPDAFLQSHIPGSSYLNTTLLERLPLWNAMPDAKLLAQLAECGIHRDTTVVLYGRNSAAAARAAHLMLYAGVADVRLLDGGFDAWRNLQLPLAASPPHRYRPRSDFGSEQPLQPQFMVKLQQVKEMLAKPQQHVLASIRSHEEFTGAISGYSYIAARGDIPGAVWGRAGVSTDMNSMSAYQQADGRMLPAQDILAFWREAGITPDKAVCFYCGTGWRASLAFFYAWLMGWQHISVFDGGWFEWSSDPRNGSTVPSDTR